MKIPETDAVPPADKLSQAQNSKTKPPRHIAVIMDGNGRWAKSRGLPRTAGHAPGAETFRRIAAHCRDIGVEYLTVYAFSTENWKRPAEETGLIMDLLERYLTEAIGRIEQDRVRIRICGDLAPLSDKLRKLIAETEESTAGFLGCQVNICVNYGAREEILFAARRFAEDIAAGEETDLSEAVFSSYLYSAGVPDPDLIIRTSGELRLSNFLLWQAAYAELYFTDRLWPDFSERDLDAAIADYQKRSRRFGDVV